MELRTFVRPTGRPVLSQSEWKAAIAIIVTSGRALSDSWPDSLCGLWFSVLGVFGCWLAFDNVDDIDDRFERGNHGDQ